MLALLHLENDKVAPVSVRRGQEPWPMLVVFPSRRGSTAINSVSELFTLIHLEEWHLRLARAHEARFQKRSNARASRPAGKG